MLPKLLSPSGKEEARILYLMQINMTEIQLNLTGEDLGIIRLDEFLGT